MTCVNARLDSCFHVFSQIHLSSDPLLNMAYLKAAVILLLGKMRRFYAHILVGNWLILYIAELILVSPAYFYNHVSDTEWCEAELLKDVLSTHDDESELMFADGSGLELSHLNCLILNVATNREWLAIFWAFHVCYCTNSCILCWVCFLFLSVLWVRFYNK